MGSKALFPFGGAGRVLRQSTHRKDQSLLYFWSACTKCPGFSVVLSLMGPSVGIVGTCVFDTGAEDVLPDLGMLHLVESARQGGEASPGAASRAPWRSFESRVQRACQRSCQSSECDQSADARDPTFHHAKHPTLLRCRGRSGKSETVNFATSAHPECVRLPRQEGCLSGHPCRFSRELAKSQTLLSDRRRRV